MLMSGGGGVKAVYRGTTTGAQTVELPAAVNMNKSFIYSVSKGSAGYVGANGSFTIPEMPLIYHYINNDYYIYLNSSGKPFDRGENINTTPSIYMKMPSKTVNIVSGGTNLTVKEYSARLIDETRIQTDGPVEWQLIEYN